MEFTAEQYRVAAAIAQQDGDGVLSVAASEWEEKADELDHFDKYVTDLALGLLNHQREPLVAVGYRLVTRLLADGWIAPEGMI